MSDYRERAYELLEESLRCGDGEERIALCESAVREADLCGDLFLEPATAEEHYEPPRHYLHLLPSGHSPRPGPFVAV